MKKTILLLTIILAIAGPVAAQSPKASEQSKAKPAAPAKKNNGTFLQSHSKQIGGFGPFQVHSLRIRGLDSPNVSAAVIYDPRSETYTVVGPATGAGLGSAILGAAGNVGSAAVFGASLRPDRTSVSNNSESEGSSAKSTSEGGSAVALAEGGDAVSVSNAAATSAAVSTSTSTSTATATNNNENKNKAPKPPKN